MVDSEEINDNFEKLLLIGEDSSVSSLKNDLLAFVVHHLAVDLQHLRASTAIRGFNLLLKVCSDSPEKLQCTKDNLFIAICAAINSGDKLCGFGLALVQTMLSSKTGLAMILERKEEFLSKLTKSVSLPSLTDCHIKAIECIWQIRKSSFPLVPGEVLEVTDMLFTYMISESGENKFKLLTFLMDIIHAAKGIITGETISESWISFLLNTVEEDDGIGNVRSLRILLTLTTQDKFVLKRPNSARNMLFLLKQSLERFINKLETSRSSKRAQCLSDLYSLSASHLPIIFDYATQEDIQLHSVMLQFIQGGNNNDVTKAAGILWNMAEDGDETVVQRLLDANAHIIAFDILRKYATESDTKKRDIFSSLLTMLLHISRFSSARKELLKLDKIVEYLIMIIEKGSSVFGCDSLRAMVLLVFLLGTEEAESILRSGKYMVSSEHVQRLVTILKSTLKSEHGDDYRLGYFCIPLLVHACLALSQSDSNKVYLLDARVVEPLSTILQMFQQDQPSIPLCGGGGEDVQSCTIAIEVLMHLSFHFQHSNDDLFETFILRDDNMSLLDTLTALQSNTKLMMDTRSKAAVLSHRLHLGARVSVTGSETGSETETPTVPQTTLDLLNHHSLRLLSTEDDAMSISSASAAHIQSTSPIRDLSRSLSQSLGTPSPRTVTNNANQVSTIHPYLQNTQTGSSGKEKGRIVDGWNVSGELISPAVVPRKQHIMLSYSWHPSAKPQLVIQLQEELKRLGYDVWRDETGSLLVPPLAGCAMMEERLADAIEASDTLIVCVSPAYKLSSNCRMEANYASVIARRHKRLKILYLMMDEEYTTVSKPAYCDGWLAAIIGTSVWYPLFDNELVTFTASSLLRHFGESTHVILREQVAPEKAVTGHIPCSLMTGGGSIDSGEIDDDHMSALTEVTSAHPAHTVRPATTASTNMATKFGSRLNGGLVTKPSPSTASSVPSRQLVHSSSSQLSKRPIALSSSKSTPDASASAASSFSKIPRGSKLSPAVSSTARASNIPSHTGIRQPSNIGSPHTNHHQQHQQQHHVSVTPSTNSSQTTVAAAFGTPSPAPSSSSPEELAWDLLNTTLVIKDEDGLQSYLLEEGILQAADLRYCDQVMLDTIASFLKTIPRRKFLEAIKTFTPYQSANANNS